MKIVQIISSVSPRFGGPSAGAVALNIALRSQGHDATIITGAYAGHDGSLMREEELGRLREQGASIIALPPARPYGLKRSRGMLREILQGVKEADLVYVHGQYEYAQVATLIALLRNGRRTSLQPHGVFEPYQLAKGRWKKALYHLAVGRPLLTKASSVVFASQSEAERATFVEASKKVVAPLGVQLEPSEPRADLLNVIGMRPRGRCVLFLGRLAKKKRPDLLIEAWSRLKRPQDALLVVAGPDDDWTAASLRSISDSLGVGESVAFVGPVTGGNKTWLYESCGVFVLPSDNENFGISVGEALVSGCCCVVTDQVASSEHVLRASAGVVIPTGSREALVSALESTMRMPLDALEQMGNRARSYASECLNWHSFAQRILESVPGYVDD